MVAVAERCCDRLTRLMRELEEESREETRLLGLCLECLDDVRLVLEEVGCRPQETVGGGLV
jgi:hypothetical protein